MTRCSQRPRSDEYWISPLIRRKTYHELLPLHIVSHAHSQPSQELLYNIETIATHFRQPSDPKPLIRPASSAPPTRSASLCSEYGSG